MGLRYKPQTFRFQRSKTHWENSRNLRTPSTPHVFWCFWAEVVGCDWAHCQTSTQLWLPPVGILDQFAGTNISGQRFSFYLTYWFFAFPNLHSRFPSLSDLFWPFLPVITTHQIQIVSSPSGLRIWHSTEVFQPHCWMDMKHHEIMTRYKSCCKIATSFWSLSPSLSPSSKSSFLWMSYSIYTIKLFRGELAIGMARPGMLGKGTCIFW